jgi:hypothetical protein
VFQFITVIQKHPGIFVLHDVSVLAVVYASDISGGYECPRYVSHYYSHKYVLGPYRKYRALITPSKSLNLYTRIQAYTIYIESLIRYDIQGIFITLYSLPS